MQAQHWRRGRGKSYCHSRCQTRRCCETYKIQPSVESRCKGKDERRGKDRITLKEAEPGDEGGGTEEKGGSWKSNDTVCGTRLCPLRVHVCNRLILGALGGDEGLGSFGRGRTTAWNRFCQNLIHRSTLKVLLKLTRLIDKGQVARAASFTISNTYSIAHFVQSNSVFEACEHALQAHPSLS